MDICEDIVLEHCNSFRILDDSLPSKGDSKVCINTHEVQGSCSKTNHDMLLNQVDDRCDRYTFAKEISLPAEMKLRDEEVCKEETSKRGIMLLTAGDNMPESTLKPDHASPYSGEGKTPDAAPNVCKQSVAIFWDTENCMVPKKANVNLVAKHIRDALSLHTGMDSLPIEAYGVPNKVQDALKRTGVAINDLPMIRKKDAADKLIICAMTMFAIDNPGSTILLISGDGDYSPAVRGLVRREHRVIIAIPSVETASIDLISVASLVWDWPSIALGRGIVTPKTLPDSIEVVKKNMIKMFKSEGGFVELRRIMPLYHKEFGTTLRMANYDVPKLIDLFVKLGDPFFVMENMVILSNHTAAAVEQNQQAENDVIASFSHVETLAMSDSFVNTVEDPTVEDVTVGHSNFEDDEIGSKEL